LSLLHKRRNYRRRRPSGQEKDRQKTRQLQRPMLPGRQGPPGGPNECDHWILAERGLVNRSADPADRRRNIITVTAARTQRFQQLDSVVAEVQDMLLAPLSPAEHQQLTRLLSRILSHASRQ